MACVWLYALLNAIVGSSSDLGPLPRDVTVRQLLSPLPSPTSSNPPDGGSADLFFPIDSPITIDGERLTLQWTEFSQLFPLICSC